MLTLYTIFHDEMRKEAERDGRNKETSKFIKPIFLKSFLFSAMKIDYFYSKRI